MRLTSDGQRKDAIRCYQAPGFKATHGGFKLRL